MLRGYDASEGVITVHTNIHAEKINDINQNENVCCVFYSKANKIQIRCFGTAKINHENQRSSFAWSKMSDMSKECYFQSPNPGDTINQYNDFSKEIYHKESANFSVIDVKIEKVDWLFLKREGHRRANIFFSGPLKDTWISP